MDRDSILTRKRENSKRLRSDPSYREREARYSAERNKSPEVKAKKVVNQVRYERKLKYGITEADYQRLAERQDFSCAICGTDEPAGRGGLHVDHDHKTDVIRGLLCFHCNVGLGHFKDNAEVLQRAIDYLAKSQSN